MQAFLCNKHSSRSPHLAFCGHFSLIYTTKILKAHPQTSNILSSQAMRSHFIKQRIQGNTTKAIVMNTSGLRGNSCGPFYFKFENGIYNIGSIYTSIEGHNLNEDKN
jgi:hypothetical protein